MVFHYEIESLSHRDVVRAFAVMQVVVPALDLETWRRLTATEAQRRQWATAKDARGYIRGIFRMTPVKHPLLGDLLDVPVFASISLIDESGVSREIIAFARRWAEREGCRMIHIWSSAPASIHVLEQPQSVPNVGFGMIYSVE
tara:strand:+ start:84 stop:512 length:429 start_codon:yes stop_codon:yes gene_type:complete